MLTSILQGVQTVEASQQVITPIGGGIVMSGTTPIVETRSHTVAYEAGQEPFGSENGFQRSDIPGELISCRTISSGNRTVETITVCLSSFDYYVWARAFIDWLPTITCLGLCQRNF